MNLRWPVRAQKHRHEQVGTRRGVPSAAKASPPGGLVVSDPDCPIGGATDAGHQVSVGRTGGLDVFHRGEAGVRESGYPPIGWSSRKPGM